MNECCFKARLQLRSYWAHLHIKHLCEVEITYMCNNIRQNLINEEWNKRKNDAPFVAFYDMRAVMFVLPDEMADVSIAGLQWFISYTLIKPDGVSQANWFSFLILITSRKKYRIWKKNYPACCNPTNYRESSCLSLILVASYYMPEKGRGPTLYSKTRGTWWPWIAHLSHFPHKWILHLCSFGSNLWSPVLILSGNWQRSTRRCYIPKI